MVWGGSLLKVENAFDLLRIFQILYHLNGRLPLTNGLPENMKYFKVQNPMALSLSSFYAPWTYFFGEIFLYQNMFSLSSIITFLMKR